MNFRDKIRPIRLFIIAGSISLSFIFHVCANSLVPADQSVNDFANVLTEKRKIKIESMLNRVERQTGVEIAVITIPSLSDYKEKPGHFDSFVQGLFNEWGIGHKSTNNGVLILVAIKDQMVRFQFGAAIKPKEVEGLQEILDQKLVPLFRIKNYDDALTSAAVYAAQDVTVSVSFWNYYRSAFFMAALALVFFLVCLIGFVNQRKGLSLVAFLGTGVFVFLLFRELTHDLRLPGFGGGTTAGVGLTKTWKS